MKYSLSYFLLGLVGISLFACTKKKPDNTIIIHKAQLEKPQGTHKVGDRTQEKTLSWGGKEYHISILRKANTDAPQIKDASGTTYYDNDITVKIARTDSSVFFEHTFKKSEFAAFMDDNYRNKSVLYSIIFLKNKPSYLLFTATVGSPDQTSSDEYLPFAIKISPSGTYSIDKDVQMENENVAMDY